MNARTTSAPDPYRFFYQDWNNGVVIKAMVGKTLRDPRLVPGERTGVFITCGQSLAARTSEGLYTPTMDLLRDVQSDVAHINERIDRVIEARAPKPP